jgi:hypothetical protein
VLGLVIALPIVAAAAVALFTRSRLPMVSRVMTMTNLRRERKPRAVVPCVC